jgi:hypothetical protein
VTPVTDIGTFPVDEDLDSERPRHPQVHIRHGRMVADVDEGMAALIVSLWKAGIATCCIHARTPGVLDA